MFESRKAHLKPVLHPTAMHPKMARALINIVNSNNIIDPFCGACGILTEAGLLGIKFIGYDIDKNVLESARKNLEYYDVDSKHYKLILKDSTTLKNLQNVVTDLPYGKSSKKSEELITLYAKFLKNLSGRAVIVMPDFMPYKKLIDKNLPKSLVVLTVIDHYVHKSLTRKIIIVDKKSGSKTKKIIVKTVKKKIKRVKKTSVAKKVLKKKYHSIKLMKIKNKKIIPKKHTARKKIHKKKHEKKSLKQNHKRKRK